jgi:two-component system, NtrC family, response regulator AtoC
MRILIVDDEPNVREALSGNLRLEGYETCSAADAEEAQRLVLAADCQVAIVDLRLPGVDGISLLKWIRAQKVDLPVIMISAYREVPDVVRALRLGAVDYVVKPFGFEEIAVRLRRLLAQRQARATEPGAGIPPPDALGRSAAMAKLKRLVARAGPVPSTVLITGESGTGKEVVARAIHAISPWGREPFLAINMAGLPETLAESELFGYERGAFTGADSRKHGLLEQAGSGTVFLDEIGDLAPRIQVKLLRVLQDRAFLRLGGLEPVRLQARIMTATHQRLDDKIASGEFREDLYYRLNVLRIEVPPLRERPDDIPLLAGRFVSALNQRMGRHIEGLSLEALAELATYSFPGNVRELENVIERAYVGADGATIESHDLDLPGDGRGTAVALPLLKSLERAAIVEVLDRTAGNRTRAAELLGVTRRTLFTKVREYAIPMPPRTGRSRQR